MLFIEYRFLIFFIILFIFYWLVRYRYLRILILTLSSFVFYGAWDYRFLLLISFVIGVTYTSQILLTRLESEQKRSIVTSISITLLLSVLAFFKYFGFFSENLIVVTQKLGLHLSQPTINIILPVGISFYIFQAIGFVIDVHWRRFEKSLSLLDVSFFIAFFPQLVAGPIVRAEIFIPQIYRQQKLKDLPIAEILILFMGGFFKKAVIADNIGLLFVDPVFLTPGAYDSSAIILSTFAYAIQIYCDFSGYSDMAIAISLCFGFRLPINFRAPYFSASITEFWQRWNISLSSWLKDYLYISLGGNRKGVKRTYINLLTTMVLGGLWHGASWNFLIWGYMHGSVLAIERLLSWPKLTSKNQVTKILGVLFTFYLTCISWIFFRATSLDASLYMSSVMLGAQAQGQIGVLSTSWLLVAGLGFLHFLVFHFQLGQRLSKLPLPVLGMLCGIWLAFMLPFVRNEVQPFIYFQF